MIPCKRGVKWHKLQLCSTFQSDVTSAERNLIKALDYSSLFLVSNLDFHKNTFQQKGYHRNGHNMLSRMRKKFDRNRVLLSIVFGLRLISPRNVRIGYLKKSRMKFQLCII